MDPFRRRRTTDVKPFRGFADPLESIKYLSELALELRVS